MLAKRTFTLDCFAYATNAKCQKFYSKVPSPHSAGINAFQQDWSQEFNYVCPPVKMIINTIQHILVNPSQGVLVVPYWPSNCFWTILTTDGTHLLEIFYRHHIFYPRLIHGDLCEPTFFLARARGKMLALFFNSTISITNTINHSLCLESGCMRCNN